MKKYVAIVSLVIILITLATVGYLYLSRYYAPTKHNIVYSENLDRKNLDLVVSDYIKNNYFNWSNVTTKKKYEVHKIYGIDKKLGHKYVYLYTRFDAYEAKSDNKTSIAGGANPLVIIVNEDSKGIYSVVNHKEPSDGEGYASSLKRIFPKKYLANIKEAETLNELNDKMNSLLNQVDSN